MNTSSTSSTSSTMWSRIRKATIAVAVAAVAAALLLMLMTGCAPAEAQQPEAAPPKELVPTPRATPKRTPQQIWFADCALCHGNDGESTDWGAEQGAPADLYTQIERYKLEKLLKRIEEHPRLEHLTNAERLTVAQHLEYSVLIRRIQRRRVEIDRVLRDLQERLRRQGTSLPPCPETGPQWPWK